VRASGILSDVGSSVFPWAVYIGVAATAVNSLPPCGGGLGRGVHTGSPDAATPLPNPPPQGGREQGTLGLDANFQTATTVIASEAKQSMPAAGKMDCFVAFAPRNDVETHLHIPAAQSRPSRASIFRPVRAWGMPGAHRTRSLAWEK
jgi:hypothetical protein